MLDSLRDTLLARVYDVAIKTPLRRAPKLSATLGHELYLKREDLQPVHSFKIRGAYNKISQLTDAERSRGIIAASAGNHAQGVALSAHQLGISALIVMPRTTPEIKVEAVRGYGAEIELFGDNYSEAAMHCKQRAEQTGRVFVHPFDDPLVIAGQGTIGREVLEQLPQVTHIFVPIGGGGLIAGIAQFVKELNPGVKVIGVEPTDSNAMQASLNAGKIVELPHVGIFADGVAVKRVGDNTFKLVQQYVDEVITVSTDQMCAAIKSIFEDTRSIVEPSGALAVAGATGYKLPSDAQVVCVCSGANVTFERLSQVAERTLIGSGKEAVFAVTMPEEQGALRTFCSKVVNGHNISEFNYRLDKREAAHVMVGVNVSSDNDKKTIMKKMTKHGYEHVDLSDDDLTKEHVRHMVGGRPAESTSESIYEVTFPERPGALGDFLDAIGNNWNISLFHYRSAASDQGSVLIGFETDDPASLEQSLTQAAFEWRRPDSPALKLFSQ